MVRLALVAAIMALSAPASALTVIGTLTPTYDSSGRYEPVRFRIAGLVEGDNDGSQTMLTVTAAPFAQAIGDYDFLFSGFPGVQPAFTVSGRSVTFAFAAFERGTTRFYIGTDGTWLNEVFDSETRDSLYAVEVPTFAAVPEPQSWAMLTAGFALAGASLRRRRAVPA